MSRKSTNKMNNAMSAYAKRMYFDTEPKEVKVSDGSFEDEMVNDFAK